MISFRCYVCESCGEKVSDHPDYIAEHNNSTYHLVKELHLLETIDDIRHAEAAKRFVRIQNIKEELHDRQVDWAYVKKTVFTKEEVKK